MASVLWFAIATASAASAHAQGFSLDGRRARPDWDYDGTRILGHVGNEVRLWDARSGRLLRTFAGHQQDVRFVQFSPTGTLAVSSAFKPSGGDGCPSYRPSCWSKDNVVRLWDLETGKQAWSIDGQAGAEFMPDGKRLMTLAMRDSSGSQVDVVMWDIASKRALFRVRAGWPLRFSTDGTYFLTYDLRDAVVYDAENGKEIGRLRIPGNHGISFYGRTGEIATYGQLGIEIWDPRTSQRVRQIPIAGAQPWESSEWTQDGKRVVGYFVPHFTGGDGQLQIGLWDIESGEMIGGMNCSPTPQQRLLISPDGSRLLCEWGKSNVAPTPEWGLNDLRGIPRRGVVRQRAPRVLPGTGRPIEIHEQRGDVIGFSPDSKTFLVSGAEPVEPLLSHDSQVAGPTFTIYSAESGEPLRSLDLLHQTVIALPRP